MESKVPETAGSLSGIRPRTSSGHQLVKRSDVKLAESATGSVPIKVREARADFAAWLRELKLRAGDPSLRELERRTKRSVARSTIHEGLAGVRLLSLEQALGIVAACTGSDPRLLRECRARWVAARSGRGGRWEDHFVSLEEWSTETSVVVRVFGELDLHQASRFGERVLAAVEQSGRRHLVLDLTFATFTDSSFLGVLVYVGAKLRRGGIVPCLVLSEADNPGVLGCLRLVGLDGVFPMHHTLDAALSEPPQPLPARLRNRTAPDDPPAKTATSAVEHV